MLGKTTLIVGAAAGYVLGARAGRQRYDQIVEQANSLWRNPKVQQTVSDAQDAAQKQTAAVADMAREKVATSSDEPAAPKPATPGTTPHA